MHRKPLSRARHVAGTPSVPTILFWTPEEAVVTPQMRLKGRERLPDQLAPHNTGCRDLIYSTPPRCTSGLWLDAVCDMQGVGMGVLWPRSFHLEFWPLKPNHLQ